MTCNLNSKFKVIDQIKIEHIELEQQPSHTEYIIKKEDFDRNDPLMKVEFVDINNSQQIKMEHDIDPLHTEFIIKDEDKEELCENDESTFNYFETQETNDHSYVRAIVDVEKTVYNLERVYQLKSKLITQLEKQCYRNSKEIQTLKALIRDLQKTKRHHDLRNKKRENIHQ